MFYIKLVGFNAACFSFVARPCHRRRKCRQRPADLSLAQPRSSCSKPLGLPLMCFAPWPASEMAELRKSVPWKKLIGDLMIST